MAKEPVVHTIKGYCMPCGVALTVSGTEKELLEGKRVACPNGHEYTIGWQHPKKNSRGDHGGIFQYGPAHQFQAKEPKVEVEAAR